MRRRSVAVYISISVVICVLTVKYFLNTFDDDELNLMKGSHQLSDTIDRKWSPPKVHNGTFDKYLVYEDELRPSLNYRLIDKICPDTAIIVIVCSSLANHRQRSVVRDTWAKGAHERGIFLFFAIGASLNGSLMDRALQEDGVHSDMVAWPFIDSYDNFTLKVISSLAWVDSACKEATYIIKTDDDMYVDLDLVSSLFVDSEPKWRNTVIGFERYYPTVNRNQSKYHYIPIEVQADLPPQYLVGAFVAYGRQALTSILTLTMTSLPALYIEDTFLTGFMAQEAGVPRWSLKLRYYSENCSYSNSQTNKNALIIGDKCTADEMQHLYDIKLTDNFSKISGIQDDVHGTKS